MPRTIQTLSPMMPLGYAMFVVAIHALDIARNVCKPAIPTTALGAPTSPEIELLVHGISHAHVFVAAAQGAPPNGPFSAEGALPNQMNWPEAGVSGVLWAQRRPKTPRTKLPVVVSSAAVGRFLFPRRSGWPAS